MAWPSTSSSAEANAMEAGREARRVISSSAFGPLRTFEIPLALCSLCEFPLAPCHFLGQRAGRPHRAAYSLAQMPLRHTMGLARPPWLARVALQHARLLPAARCSHPSRLLTGWVRVAGEPGPRQPEHQKPSVAAGAARRGRFLGRRGADRTGRCAQRTSSSFWPRLSERSARRARSEFCGPTRAGAPQGSRRVQRPTVPV